MKKLISRSVQCLFALAALCLLAALIIPWPSPSPLPLPFAGQAVMPADLARARPRGERGSPESVLSLFEKRSNSGPMQAAPPPEARKPADAPWLLYLGFYSSSSGGPSYVLKDTRSGRLIAAASRGASAQGWSVVAVEKNVIIVRNGSDLFIVQKR